MEPNSKRKIAGPLLELCHQFGDVNSIFITQIIKHKKRPLTLSPCNQNKPTGCVTSKKKTPSLLANQTNSEGVFYMPALTKSSLKLNHNFKFFPEGVNPFR